MGIAPGEKRSLWMRVILNENPHQSVPAISKAVFSISKNDQVSAATCL